MKLKDLLIEKRNDRGVPIVTKKSDVKKFLKQVEKAEKELDKVRVAFNEMYSPARSMERAEKNSFHDYKRETDGDVKMHNSNYATEVENIWANIAGNINGNIVFSIGKLRDMVRTLKSDLSKLQGKV